MIVQMIMKQNNQKYETNKNIIKFKKNKVFSKRNWMKTGLENASCYSMITNLKCDTKLMSISRSNSKF